MAHLQPVRESKHAVEERARPRQRLLLQATQGRAAARVEGRATSSRLDAAAAADDDVRVADLPMDDGGGRMGHSSSFYHSHGRSSLAYPPTAHRLDLPQLPVGPRSLLDKRVKGREDGVHGAHWAGQGQGGT